MIPEDKVSEIRDRTDLAALISEYVELKRSGTSLKGLCPFHGEKTPSFYVHPDRGFFHCFGCQASGDAISFLMRLEGHTFPEALRILAERAGVEVVSVDAEQDRAARRERARRERLLSIVEAAAGFFVKMLREHRFGPMAWAELERRAITEATVDAYRLGYAPDGWDGLATYLFERGFSPTECETVGLVVPRRNAEGYYDRFRHRLMFPVSDAHGRIVAFSGRALEPVPGDARPDRRWRPERAKRADGVIGDGGGGGLAPHGAPRGAQSDREPPAKYVNSPETELYKKGELLFGLHEARVELRRRDVALLCEGNFDVVALAQAGFANVVAPLGTAFTLAQAKLLRRFAATAVLLFDADSAGRKAARAAQPLLASVGLAGKVVTLPPGEDPDSYLRGRGAEAMGRLIDQAPAIVQWLIDSAALEAGADPHARAEAIQALGPVLAALDNPVEARLYVERVAKAFEVADVLAVREQLRRGVRAAKGPQKGGRRPEPAPPRPPPARPRGRLPENEAKLVGAFLDHPGLLSSGEAEKVQVLLTSPDLRAILSATARWVGARGVDASALLAEVEEGSPAREWLQGRLAVQEFEDEASAGRFVERVVATLSKKQLERENKRLSQEILAARRAGDDDRAQALMRQKSELFQSARPTGTRVKPDGGPGTRAE